MVKPDKYNKTTFSRNKVQASSEEDIIKNNATFDEQKKVRLEEREKNKKKAVSNDNNDNNDNNDK